MLVVVILQVYSFMLFCMILVVVISDQDSTRSGCFSLYPSDLTVILWCSFRLISVWNTVDEWFRSSATLEIGVKNTPAKWLCTCMEHNKAPEWGAITSHSALLLASTTTDSKVILLRHFSAWSASIIRIWVITCSGEEDVLDEVLSEVSGSLDEFGWDQILLDDKDLD